MSRDRDGGYPSKANPPERLPKVDGLPAPGARSVWYWATPPCPTCGEHPAVCGHEDV